MKIETVWNLKNNHIWDEKEFYFVWDEKEFCFKTWEIISWVQSNLETVLKTVPDLWKSVEEWKVD